MFKTVLGCGAMFAALSVAQAADLPLRSAPPPFAPPPVFTWTGAYLGGNAGYAFEGDTLIRSALPDGTVFDSVRVHDDGFTGGGQIGYNYQLGAGSPLGFGNGVVVGLEADAAYTDLSKSEVIAPNANFRNGFGGTYHGQLDFLGTVRGRVGFAFDRFLIYGTGGFAYGSVNDSLTVTTGTGALFARGNRNEIATGYTYGGGVEYALPATSFLNVFKSSAVTIKAEYLHYDLGDRSFVVDASAETQRFGNEGDLVRAGINYKF